MSALLGMIDVYMQGSPYQNSNGLVAEMEKDNSSNS